MLRSPDILKRDDMEKYIPLKTSIETMRIKKACHAVSEILEELKNYIRPGISTLEIDRFCAAGITARNAKPALKGYKGFPGNVCISVNNVAAHGIGGCFVLKNGDIVTVDITLSIDGWYGDGAMTYVAGSASDDVRRLIKAAWFSTMAGIVQAAAGKRMGDIGYAVRKKAEDYGCRILRDFTGHGIGREMHEEPAVLNFGIRGQGIPIVPGMVITVEPIVTLGIPDVKLLQDGWSVVTKDNSLTAQFEHTVAVFGNRTEILTKTEDVPTSLPKFPFPDL